MHVRAFKETDLGELQRLDAEMTQNLIGADGKPYEEAFLRNITSQHSEAYRTLVWARPSDFDAGGNHTKAEQGVGFLIYKLCKNGCKDPANPRKKKRATYVELFFLAVDSNYRHQGIGRSLFHAMIDSLRSETVPSRIVSIRLHVIKGNKVAIQLYTSLGFRIMGPLKIGYPQEGFASYRMILHVRRHKVLPR